MPNSSSIHELSLNRALALGAFLKENTGIVFIEFEGLGEKKKKNISKIKLGLQLFHIIWSLQGKDMRNSITAFGFNIPLPKLAWKSHSSLKYLHLLVRLITKEAGLWRNWTSIHNNKGNPKHLFILINMQILLKYF